MKALLVIDIQNDFCEGGALAVPDANSIIPIINNYINRAHKNGWITVLTQDYHPSAHGSFASSHNAEVFSMGSLGGNDQVMWPDHCVQGTDGAAFHEDLNKCQYAIRKGMNPEVDSYSGFFDNNNANDTGLNRLLQSFNVNEVYIVGLATDYCVMYTALDAVKLGFKTFVILDGCKGVDFPKGTVKCAVEDMKQAGVTVLETLRKMKGNK